MTVAQILRKKGSTVATITAATTIEGAISALAEWNVGALVVTDPEGRIDGILSERDVVRGLARTGKDLLDEPVRTIMTGEVVTCEAGDHVAEIMEKMTSRRIRHVPVVADQKLVGIISIGDVVKRRMDELADEAQNAREFINTY